MIEEALEEPGFYILGAFGTIAIIVGWIASKKMELISMPIWQLIIMILVAWIASAYFVTKD